MKRQGQGQGQRLFWPQTAADKGRTKAWDYSLLRDQHTEMIGFFKIAFQEIASLHPRASITFLTVSNFGELLGARAL